MTTQSVKIITADLKSKYNEIEIEKNQAQFFTKIAHYGKYILENDTTISILNALYEDEQKDKEAYIESFKKFIKVWKVFAVDILEKAEIAGIKDVQNNPLSSEIGNIKNKLQQEDILLWESDLGDYFNPYFSLIRKFETTGKSDLLIPKHFEKDQPLTIYSAYTQAEDEWKKFRNFRETSVWWAYYQICRATAGILDFKGQGNFFIGDDVVSGFYKSEFNELSMGNRISTPIVLHKSKFDVWIKRLHEYLMPRLENLTEIVNQKQSKSNNNVRFENNTLFIILKDGTEGTLDFENAKETKNMLYLFSILYKHWQKYGDEPLETIEIKRRLAKEGLDSGLVNSSNFLTSTISNIRKKIMNKNLSNTVKVLYDKGSQGYLLIIKT